MQQNLNEEIEDVDIFLRTIEFLNSTNARGKEIKTSGSIEKEIYELNPEKNSSLFPIATYIIMYINGMLIVDIGPILDFQKWVFNNEKIAFSE